MVVPLPGLVTAKVYQRLPSPWVGDAAWVPRVHLADATCREDGMARPAARGLPRASASRVLRRTGGPRVSGDDGGLGQIPDAGITTSCRPELADDCPEGQKCTAYSLDEGGCCVGANKCVPILGDRQLGESCTRTTDNDDCGDRLFCMTRTSGDVGPGTCLLMCDWTAPDSCPEIFGGPATCLPLNGGVLPVCERNCHPLLDECPAEYGCFPVGNAGFFCAPSTPIARHSRRRFTIFAALRALPPERGLSGRMCSRPLLHANLSREGREGPCVAPETCVPYYDPDDAPRPELAGIGYCGVDP